MVIGVFDSGIGGLSVARAIKDAFPQFDIDYRADTEHLPYGNKSPEQILGFVTPIIYDLAQKCDVIIIACNTVTTTLIDKLRTLTTVPIIGIEPMIKPTGKITRSNVITVCATPATLHSDRYAYLKNTYAANVNVIEPDCSDWASLIENNAINEAKTLGVPVVALADTNVDPSRIDYVIPGNDDAIKGVQLILDYVAQAVEAGKGVSKKEKGEEA